MPTADATSSRRPSGICGRRPRSTPAPPDRASCSATSTTPGTAFRPPPTTTRRTSISTTDRRACSTSSRWRATAQDSPTLGIEALQKAVAIDEGFAEAYYLMGLCQRDAQQPAQALVSLRKAIALAPALLQAREELADLYGRLGRTEEWITQLEALRALDPEPGARRHPGARLLEGRPVRPRRHHASPRSRATSRLSAHLRRARPRLAGDGAGPLRSGRIEQGSRGARDRRSTRKTPARRTCCSAARCCSRPTPSPPNGCSCRRRDTAAGRSAGLLLPRRRRGAPRALRRRAAGAARLHRAGRRGSRCAAQRRARPSASAISRCGSRTFPSPRPGTNAPPEPLGRRGRSSSSSPTRAGAQVRQTTPDRCSTRFIEKNPANTAARNLRKRVR